MKTVTNFENLDAHDLHLAYCGMDTMLTHELFGILEPKRKRYVLSMSLKSLCFLPSTP